MLYHTEIPAFVQDDDEILKARDSDPLVEKFRLRYLAQARKGLLEGLSERRQGQEKDLAYIAHQINSFFTGSDRPILIMIDGQDGSGKSSTISRLKPAFNNMKITKHIHFCPEMWQQKDDYWMDPYLGNLPETNEVILWDRSYLSRITYDNYYGIINNEEAMTRCKEICTLEDNLARNGTRVYKFYLDAGNDRLAKTLAKREVLTPERLTKADYFAYRDKHVIRRHFLSNMTSLQVPSMWNIIEMDNRFEGRLSILTYLKEKLS